MVASRGQLSPVRLSKVSFFRLQLQQLLEIRALAQGGEVLVLLHVGGVLVALGDGVLEQGQRFLGTLFGEAGRVRPDWAIAPCYRDLAVILSSSIAANQCSWSEPNGHPAFCQM